MLILRAVLYSLLPSVLEGQPPGWIQEVESVLYWSSFILSNSYFYFTTFQSKRWYFLFHYFFTTLIIFNEPVISVRKSLQTINSQIGMIQLQLFSSRQFTDSNDPFRASLKWTKLIRTGRSWEQARNWCCEKLLMSNFRINYCNWKSYLGQKCQLITGRVLRSCADQVAGFVYIHL